MTTPAKAAGLTVLVLALAGTVWFAEYAWHEDPTQEIPATDDKPVVEAGATAVSSSPLGLETSRDFSLELKEKDLLPNPFVLKGTSTLPQVAWQLQDSQGIVVADGTIIPEAGSFESLGWYSKRPTNGKGTLVFIRIGSPISVPLYSLPVSLQTEEQKVEIYFLDSKSKSCTDVVPVKRTVVSTDGNQLNYYEAAIRSLLLGPTEKERESGLVTRIPDEAQIIKIGKDEKGRYIADMDGAIAAQDISSCDRQAIKAQMANTLITVPLDGQALKGRLFLDGEEAKF